MAPDPGKDLIRAENISRTLPGEVPVTLVKDADFLLSSGEICAITGPSGSGKSSLLYLLGLLDTPDRGRVYLSGRDTSSLSQNELAAIRLEKIGFVFQFHFLLPEFTALENVTMPMKRLKRPGAAGIEARGRELLEKLGLADHFHKLPTQMSGGQCQRVAIARALANDPPVILADEPTGNLDSAASSVVRDILRDLADGEGRGVAVVSHDPEFFEAADRRVNIVDGRIV